MEHKNKCPLKKNSQSRSPYWISITDVKPTPPKIFKCVNIKELVL